MIQEQFVSYNIALKLKELGCNIKCIATIDQTEYLHIKGTKSSSRGSMIYDTIDCPLYQQVFEFFRDKGLYVSGIDSVVDDETSIRTYFYHTIYDKNDKIVSDCSDDFNTYKEAQIACINKLIELTHDK